MHWKKRVSANTPVEKRQPHHPLNIEVSERRVEKGENNGDSEMFETSEEEGPF